MSQLFTNKYQPKYFKDFEMEDEFTKVLNFFINMNNLNIIFVGDFGSGKTSILDAVVREYYGTDNYKDNVLYINSLKEQGINYYRNDVKTFCHTRSSVKNKKKIIILDDLDFINEQSQQVFRNYIDKFSHNVHFIASCTNIQKIIESLQSRFIIAKLKPLQKNNLEKIMEKIEISEKIQIHPDAREFILKICNNSAKVLINYMEKFKLLNEDITLELANNVCTNISFFILEKYTRLVKEQNLTEAIKLFYDIHDVGYSTMDILDNYFFFVKVTEMLTENEKYKIIPHICKYINVFHNIHEDEIELAFFTNNIIQSISEK